MSGLLAINMFHSASVVYAADQLRDDPRARQFFEVGAQAYHKGQYNLAIDAFQQAYSLTERPGLLFSLGQAYQRQFRVDGNPTMLFKAIECYRKYLARPEGKGRQREAEAALTALLPVADRLRGVDASGHASVFGRLMLSSATPSAVVTVNGERVESLPTSLELPEGKYHVAVSAQGFESQAQDIVIAAGLAVPLNVELVPLPARLQVIGPVGAEVLVDGRSVGILPLGELSQAPGDHSVTLRRAGYQTRTVLAHLARGARTRVNPNLEVSFRRQASWVGFGAAAVTAGFTATFATLAAVRSSSAASLDERLRMNGTLTLSEAETFNRDVAARDRFKTYALVSGVSAVALLGAAAVLYWGDTPDPPATVDARPEHARLRLTPVLGGAVGVVADAHF